MLNFYSASALLARILFGVGFGASVLMFPDLDVVFLFVYILLFSYCTYNLREEADEDIRKAGMVGDLMLVAFVAFFVQIAIFYTSFLTIH